MLFTLQQQVHHTLPPNRLAHTALHPPPPISRRIKEPVLQLSSSSSESNIDPLDPSFFESQLSERALTQHSQKPKTRQKQKFKINVDRLRSVIYDREINELNNSKSGRKNEDVYYDSNRPATQISSLKSSRRNDAFDDINKKQKSSLSGIHVVGRSIVSSSVSHVRSQKSHPFEEKTLVNPALPVSWSRLTANPVKRPRKIMPIQTNEQKILSKMMTKEELKNAKERLNLLEARRRERKENQVIPDWAKGASTILAPAKETSAKNKTKVLSKSLAVNDYLIP
ncbi:hypothetical protein TRFO_09446 [Tritrichomonas foetus]|uniref:Uncharacterized protein n=1 Tax=Tritrichomonas foetus TaxID=1144522 RepID=A0A1J4JIQ8_9EUKA|nr:hypothetical protein TRFO_09446 [Tritrichomonas foetus]|eukprot:OHS97443.1 hypothetical protein TRFO_09446 [Tritrichomonas foetus]